VGSKAPTVYQRNEPALLAFVFQFVNICVSLIMVPLLLRHLSAPEYVIWVLCAAFCGITVQLQNAILGVSTKEIASAWYYGHAGDLNAAIARSRQSYKRLAIVVAGPLLLGGACYLAYLHGAGRVAIAAWAVLAGSYALTFLFASNNAILLATDRVGLNSNISTLTRLVYLCCTVLLLALGYSILAPCIALAVSSVCGVTANTYYSRGTRVRDRESPGVPHLVARGSVFRFTQYTLGSFMLYNGALLLAAPLFPASIATYGLALQTSSLLLTVALVPLQLRLARLVGAHSRNAERLELRWALWQCNAIFAAGYLCLIFLAPLCLSYLGADVALPSTAALALMYCAFCVELNIAVLANHLTAKGDYSFTSWYAAVSIVGLGIGSLAGLLSGSLWIGFVVVPLALQLAFSLPRMARTVRLRF
jgi:hypothetical protein